MRDARRRAADLVASLRADPRGVDRVLDLWPPDDPADRAIRAVRTMTEALAPDLRAAEARHDALLARCEAFLRADEPYRWPADDFAAPTGAGPRWLPFLLVALAAASLAAGGVAGLVLGAALFVAAVAWWPLDRRWRRDGARFEAAMRGAGDPSAWPFLRREGGA